MVQALVPRRLEELLAEEESKTMAAMPPARRKLYESTKTDIKARTQGKFTPQEYHHLAVLFIVLDDADAFIQRQGGPQSVDPEFLNQVRMMRDGFLQRLREAREEQETVGNILKDTKEALLKLRNTRGDELIIIKSDQPNTLVELLEKEIEAKNAGAKQDREHEQKKQTIEVHVEKSDGE